MRKKNDPSNQIPQRCVSLSPKFNAKVRTSRLKENALENLQKILKNPGAFVSYISNSKRKIVESQQNNSRSGKQNETSSLSCILYRNYICFYVPNKLQFWKIVNRLDNNP